MYACYVDMATQAVGERGRGGGWMIKRKASFVSLREEGDRGRAPITTLLTIYSNASSYTLQHIIYFDCN